MFSLLLCILFSCSITMVAQAPEGHGPNLIPNPGFEQMSGKRIENDLEGFKTFRYNCVAWKSPSMSTPDIKIVTPYDIKNFRKKHGVTLDKPHGGYKMCAILTNNPSSERSDTYREYIQAKLDKPLIKGKEYYFEMWVKSERRAKFISNNLGVVLTPAVLEPRGWEPILNVKPEFNYSEMINPSKKEWIRLSFTFTAINRAQFIIIGNFFNNEDTKYEAFPDPLQLTSDELAFQNAYYLIDDIMLCRTAIDPPPIIEKPVVGKKIKLDRVFFETAKWDLLPQSNEQLNELVDLMNEFSGMEVEIHGHTDNRGSDSYNQRLSENRTKSVFNYLVDKGVSAERMKYIGFGEEKPIESNETAEGRQMNRRVEFVVVKIDENTEVENDNSIKPYTDKS